MNTTKQGHLQRRLKLSHVVAMGLAYMSPFAVFDTFGIVTEITDGHVPASYIVVTIAIIFTAFSYAKMARVYPFAGSAYTYARKTINSGVGFLVGWAVLLDYLFLPMINALLAKIYLSAGFPMVPGWTWIVGLILLISVLNIVGVKISAIANVIMVIFQAVLAIAFVALTARAILSDNALYFTLAPFYSISMELSGLLSGATILALAFLGFDAVTTLSEEAIEPEKNMPRAIMWIATLGSLFFITVTYFMQVFIPDLDSLKQITSDFESASPYIALTIGGIVFQTIFLAGAVVSVVSSGLASQTSTSRLLYAMGRDGIFWKRAFGYINPKFGTPVINIVIVGIVALSALFLDLELATHLINFGAFTGFMFVNLSVVAYSLRHRREPFGDGVFSWIVVPAIGAAINIYLWFNLSPFAKTVGLIWLGIGFLYLLWITRGFSKPTPKVAFEEAD